MPYTPASNVLLKQEEFHFLDNLQYWSLITAYGLAAAEGINLTSEHIKVLKLLRADYDKFGNIDTESLIEKLEADLGLSDGHTYLQHLFSLDPVNKCFRIAGLPIHYKIYYPMH